MESQPTEYTPDQPPVEVPTPSRDLDARKAVGGAVSLEFWGKDPSDFIGLTPEDLALVDPDNLNAALYQKGHNSYAIRVQWNPEEFEAIVRSPEDFVNSVIAKVFKARATDPSLERVEEKAASAVAHALGQKQETIEDMLTGLKKEREQLLRLRKEAKSPSFAHMNEGKLRILMNTIMELSFNNILRVAALTNHWDDETYKRAKQALTASLLTGGQRTKVGYWQEMLKLAITYNQDRLSKARIRSKQINKMLRDRQDSQPETNDSPRS